MSRHPAHLIPTVAGLLVGALVSTAAAQTVPPPGVAPTPKPKPAATARPLAAPAAATAPGLPVAQPAAQQPIGNPGATFQTLDQLQKAGVRRCLQVAQAVGQATITGSNPYAAASTWNTKQPDNRFSVSMIGQRFEPGQNSMANGLSGVFSVPTTEGKCDAAALQIIPTTDSCAALQAQVLAKGRALGDLAGVPLLQNAANAQVMLMPAANNSCVLVVLSTVYTE